jgi:hypothetical protein
MRIRPEITQNKGGDLPVTLLINKRGLQVHAFLIKIDANHPFLIEPIMLADVQEKQSAMKS